MPWIRASLFVAAVALLPQSDARADVTPGDVQIMARAMGFLDKPLTGEVQLGIVYAAGNAESQREADTLQKLLGNGLTVGNLTLKPVTVPVTDVARSNAGMLFLTAGLGDAASGVTAASVARHTPCVTTDLAQVRAGYCGVGVRSQPRIEILVNRAAADRSGVRFSTVFRMMITEL